MTDDWQNMCWGGSLKWRVALSYRGALVQSQVEIITFDDYGKGRVEIQPALMTIGPEDWTANMAPLP